MAMTAPFASPRFSNAFAHPSGLRPPAFVLLSFPRHFPLPIACSSNSGSGSCCGGSGGGGSSCSSHSSKNSLSNLGKEFEHLVATNTLLEFEKEYVSAPMEGNITRDIIDTVKETYPEIVGGGQKVLDINEILDEATSMSNGDFVFSEDSEFVFV